MMPIPWRRLTPLLLAVVVSGCGSSPPETFHLLSRPAGTEVASSARGYGVLVGPVSVPEVVDRPQLVIRTEASRVVIREQQRWAEPLADGIAQALAEDLNLALPQAYAYSQQRAPGNSLAPRFRLGLDVQRFESRLTGAYAGAVIESAWQLTTLATGRKSACRTVVRAALPAPGYDGLVAAHQAALAGLAERLAAVLDQLARGQEAFSLPEGTVCQRD